MKNQSDLHKHRCECGNIWEHTGANADNAEAHTCGKCGTEVWDRYYASPDEFAGRLDWIFNRIFGIKGEA